MRFLLCRTDWRIGDLVVSLPLMESLRERLPESEIFWILNPEIAPILDNIPGVAGVLHCRPGYDLSRLISYIRPDAFLNLSHRDRGNTTAAKLAGVPIRVAIPRGFRQALDATHRIQAKRSHSGRHESQLILDYLKPFGIFASASLPPPPTLVLTPEEEERGHADLRMVPAPRLGVVKRGTGSGACPSFHWWENMLGALRAAGWNPVVMSPLEEGDLAPTGVRGLLGRLNACDAVLGVSTGPMHLAAALGVPTLCLMAKSVRHGPVRWAPLGRRAAFLQYEGEEDDRGSGMDRFEPDTVLAHLEKLR